MTGGNKFSQVPEWVLDADISDGAFRLYAALLRYADQNTGRAWPARSTLAERLRRTPKSVDRYLKELSEVGAIEVHARFDKGQQKSNSYTVVTRNPNPGGATQMSPPADKGGDTDVQAGATGMSPLGATQMSHRTTPNERHPVNEGAADATHPEPSQEVAVIQGELVPAEEPKTPTTQTLVGEWLNNMSARPPQKVIGHLSREIKTLLDEGYDYGLVRAAVIRWSSKGLHPSTLASVLHEIQTNPTGNRRPTTTDRINQTLAMGEELQAMLDQQRKAS